MSLRQQAAADLGTILEDAAGGFGWPITLTNPAGTSRALTGLSTDIAQTIDPQTGMLVGGRKASVALRIASIVAAGLDLPFGVMDGAGKPWLVTFNDIGGSPWVFKVTYSDPDRALGVVICTLETYSP